MGRKHMITEDTPLRGMIKKICGSCGERLRPLVMKIRYVFWAASGRPDDNIFRFYKRELLVRTGKRFGCMTFVETGTGYGDTVQFVRSTFKRILSIELSERLFALNKRRFTNCKNIFLWKGNSGEVMPEMLSGVRGRALFWLDGHYSGHGTANGSGCPVAAELRAIGSHQRKDHCILIDDVHCFGNSPDYPATEEIRKMLLAINPDYKISVQGDCLLALPPDPSTV